MAGLGVLAIANTSSYVQGGLDVYITDNGNSKVVDIYLFFRRTNSYGGTTYSSDVTATINIGGQSTTATISPSIPAYNNNWQGWYVHFSRTFTEERDVSVGWSTRDNIGAYFSGSGSATIHIPSSYTKPNKPTISAVANDSHSITVTYGTSSFGTPSSGTVYLYGGTSSSPSSQIASKTSTGSSTFVFNNLTPNTTYYFRSNASNGQLWSDYSSTVSAKTKIGNYAPVSGKSRAVKKYYAPISSKSRSVLKLYDSNNGKSRRIY